MANEVHTAEQFVTDLLQEARVFLEVRVFIVVDNVSCDGTLEILRAYAKREPRVRVIWAPENWNIVDAYLPWLRAGFGHRF